VRIRTQTLAEENRRLRLLVAATAIEMAALSGFLELDAEDTSDPVTAVGVECSSRRLRQLAADSWKVLNGGDR
jgi:hypothetical protein